jgi:phosphohistidine phosphatase SixA
MGWLLAGAVALAALVTPTAALAQARANPPLAGAELLAALRGGGYVLYFRHADTDHSQNDSRMTSMADCANQRNLTDAGRERTRQIGDAIRALAIPIGAVLASPMCRTVETAELAFGRAEKAMAVVERGTGPTGARTYPALRVLLSTAVPAGTNTVVVGHANPYYALVGALHLAEGEAAVVQPSGTAFTEVARLTLNGWRELAATPATR